MYVFSQRLSFPGWIYFMALFRFAAPDADPALNVNPTADPAVSVNPTACHGPNSHVTSSALCRAGPSFSDGNDFARLFWES